MQVTASAGGHAGGTERGLRSQFKPSFELVEAKLHPPWARPGIVPRTELVDRLVAAGVRVHEIAESTPTLEELFVEIVGPSAEEPAA